MTTPTLKRRYDWRPDVPDMRDFKFAITRGAAAKLPPKVNRIGLSNPIEDQGDLGSCTGNASTSALEIITKAKAPLSRLMAYFNARQIEGDQMDDAGASIRSVIKGLFKVGVSSEATWPYDVLAFASMPSDAAYAEAKLLAATWNAQFDYVRVTGLPALKAALAAGQPVTFGFSVPERFEGVLPGNFLPYPTAKDRIIGGHAVVAVGYDDTAAKPFVWVRNSWGATWADRGYFKMAQEWFSNPDHMADDLWTIRPKAKVK